MLSEEPGLDEAEHEGESEEVREVELDGPDPRSWEHDPALGPLMEDVLVLHQVTDAMRGSGSGRSGAAYDPVMSLLASMRDEARGQFAAALAVAYGLTLPAPGETTAFEAAGRARAYGQEKPPGPAAP